MELRKIINDYIERMEGICEEKISLCQKQLDYEMAEMRAFNTLRQEILTLDGANTGNGIPEDKFFIPSEWTDDRPDHGREELGYNS